MSRISIPSVVVAIVVLLAAHGPAMARDKKIQKQDRTRQMRVLIGELDRLAHTPTPSNADAIKRNNETVQSLKDLFKVVSVKLLPARVKRFETQLDEIVALQQRGQWSEVATNAATWRKDLIEAFKMNLAPMITPSLDAGKRVFDEHCSGCHGASGRPPEVLMRKLHPPPTDLTDGKAMAGVSPFTIYNDLQVGIPRTAKNSFADLLLDEDLWSVAFYSMLFRYGDVATAAASSLLCKQRNPSTSGAVVVKQLRLTDLSTSTDAELLAKLRGNLTDLEYLRLCVSFDAALRR